MVKANTRAASFDIASGDELSYDQAYQVPTYRKYTIGIDEAARYYGIGEKKLRQIIADHPTEDFYLEVGRKILLKRRQFEAWLDESTSL